eukprot:3847094-Amphidinium_carterae.1
MRSTSSPSTGTETYADKVTVCATSVDAHPNQLPRHQSWQPPGETITECVRAGLWHELPPDQEALGGA